MAKEGDYTISNIYQGGYSSFNQYPNLSPETPVEAKDLGLTTDFKSANILQEINSKLSSGIKHIEISPISPDVFESIPKEHFKEARREAELVGAELTVHGSPQLEASGMTNQGFTESGREAVERQMNEVVERAHELNPDKSAPVVFHSSAGLPGQMTTKGKDAEEAYIINTETGAMNKIPLKERFFPGEEKKMNIQNELKNENEQAWTQNISHINYYAHIGAGQLIDAQVVKHIVDEKKTQGISLNEQEKQLIQQYNFGKSYIEDSYRGLRELFNKASRKSTSEDAEKIKQFYNQIESKAEKIKQNPKDMNNAYLMKEIVEEGTNVLQTLSAPETIQDLNTFAKKKTVDTFSNIALNSYNKFKENAPIISIENPPYGGAFSSGEELKSLIDDTRDKFIEKAKKQGISESEAKKQAEKLIGVTWDVGHINMMRKYGYEKEDLIKQTKAVAPLMNHMHLSDNFGFEHTELPMGMGNVPMKEIMEQIGKEGYDGKKIIEAGNWWQHFSEQGGTPLESTLKAFGSPIYQGGPSWNQALGFHQDYFGGYGMMLPSGNYNMQGSGFSMASLPTELGGQMPGAQGSRMSGRGME